MRVAHIADIHLGYRQYGLDQRLLDFQDAWFWLVEDILAQRPDVVIIAGDVFHEQHISPAVYQQCVAGLLRFQQAAIPVIVIEGNHDRRTHRMRQSWLSVLHGERLLYLLAPDEGTNTLSAWNEATHTGGYVDIAVDGLIARFYGLPYMGAKLEAAIGQLASDMIRPPDVRFVCLLLHCAMRGEMAGHADELDDAILAPLRDRVDYIALGHIHKPYSHGSWIWNPGSVESNSIEEGRWPERGWLLVDVDMRRGTYATELRPIKRRRILRVACDIGFCGGMQDVTATVMDEILDMLAVAPQHKELPSQPVIDVKLVGVCHFPASQLDIALLRRHIEDRCAALHVQIKTRFADETTTHVGTEQLSHDDMVAEILRHIIEDDPAYAAASLQWIELVQAVRQAFTHNASPEEVADIVCMKVVQP